MNDQDLTRRLHRLRRSVIMLQTELRDGRMDEPLMGEIEMQMENGISTAPQCSHLGPLLDALRESLLTPRSELFSDAARACERLKDAIEEVVGSLG